MRTLTGIIVGALLMGAVGSAGAAASGGLGVCSQALAAADDVIRLNAVNAEAIAEYFDRTSKAFATRSSTKVVAQISKAGRVYNQKIERLPRAVAAAMQVYNGLASTCRAVN